MSASADMILTPPERDALAGEYVLGLLEGADLVAFARRLDSDRALADSVERWRAHLHPIDAAVRPIAPPSGLWPRIEADLGMTAQTGARPALATASAGSRLADWWNSLFIWRGAALAGALASLLLAVGLFAALDRAQRQPVYVAVLLTEAGIATAVVNTYPDRRVEMVPLQNIAVPPGMALEIWTLWDRSVGPRSVGLIDRARTTPLRLDQLPLGRDQLFEITIEPATGSPTGRPTGPIVAKGTTSQAL